MPESNHGFIDVISRSTEGEPNMSKTQIFKVRECGTSGVGGHRESIRMGDRVVDYLGNLTWRRKRRTFSRLR